MAKQQKAKAKEVEVKKSKKAPSKGLKESQAMAMLTKRVRAALKQYDYTRDKEGQYLGERGFMSGDEVRKATRTQRQTQQQDVKPQGGPRQKKARKTTKA